MIDDGSIEVEAVQLALAACCYFCYLAAIIDYLETDVDDTFYGLYYFKASF